MYSLSKKEFGHLAQKNSLVPIYREIIADTDTPVSAFLKLKGDNNSFLLESVEGGETLGRYSFIGVSPFLIVRGKDDIVEISGEKEITLSGVDDPLKVMESLIGDYQPAPIPDLPPFFGGAVGYVGYDCVRHFENVPNENPDDLGLPDLLFLFTDSVVIFDHLRHRIKILVNARSNGDPDRSYDSAVRLIEEIVIKLRRPIEVRPLAEIDAGVGQVDANFDKGDFLKAVEKTKEYIVAGDILQAVLSQRFSIPIKANPFDIYRVLRTINPSPYLAYLDFAELKMIASSPEPLVKVDGIKVITRPIAGTRPRGKNTEDDSRLARELLDDIKERAEHIMLVDLGRNDLGVVCRPGTVKVDDLMFIERYSHVMHIVSQVSGELAEGKTAYDVLRAAFPAGTVSGAPKIRAMEIIDELEPTRRGPYAGVFGYFSFNGNLDTGITIRTIIVTNNHAYVQAGAGIVADSQPELEYQETVNKAMALLRAVTIAESQNRVEIRE